MGGKEHVLLLLGQIDTGMFHCVFDFCCCLLFCKFFPSCKKKKKKHNTHWSQRLIASHLPFTCQGLFIQFWWKTITQWQWQHSGGYIHIQSMGKNSTTSCRICRRYSLFEPNELYSLTLQKNMKISVQFIPRTHSFNYSFYSSVTPMSSVNQFCQGNCIPLSVPNILDGRKKCKTTFSEGHCEADLLMRIHTYFPTAHGKAKA